MRGDETPTGCRTSRAWPVLLLWLALPGGAEGSGCRPRPPLLTPMLAAHAGLQAADWHSTLAGLSTDVLVEGNPAVRWAARSPVRLAVVKGAGAGAFIYAVNRLACPRPRTALAVSVGVNAAYALIVGRNYRLAWSVGW